MITAGERHELKTEVKRLNADLTDILRDYGHAGDVIPPSQDLPIRTNVLFADLLSKRQMLSKVLSIFNLRFEEGFKLICYQF